MFFPLHDVWYVNSKQLKHIYSFNWYISECRWWHIDLQGCSDYRERTDLSTGSEPAPIYLDRTRSDLMKDRSSILLLSILSIQYNATEVFKAPGKFAKHSSETEMQSPFLFNV